jgi:hypothetical protein
MEKTLSAPERERNPARVQNQADDLGIRKPSPDRDVAPGECWTFTDHRALSEIMDGLL